MIRILLVDDRFLIRQALQAILLKTEQIIIAGEADCGSKALEIIEREIIDIAIVDLDMPGMNGFELTQKICQNYPQIKVIILSSHEDATSISRAIECGARGYLIKDTSIGEVVDTIERVQRGYFQLGPGLFEKLIYYCDRNRVQTSKSISNLKTKSQQDLNFMRQELSKHELQIRQEIFTELEREIEQLKFEMRQGLEDFERRAVLHFKNSLSDYVDNLKHSQHSDQTWRTNYREIARSIDSIEHNYNNSVRRLSQEIKAIKYCLIFLFVALALGFSIAIF